MAGSFGSGVYGASPYGSAPESTSFQVTGASTPGSTSVLVVFSFPLNLVFAPFTSPANYSIPGLTVVGAAIYNATTIRLTTSPQAYTLYTVTVGQGQSAGGDPLDPLYRTATFTGSPTIPVYTPVGVSPNTIRLVFTEPMLLNGAIVDPLTYTVTDIHGNVISVLTVVSEQGAGNPRAVVLGVSPTMLSAEWYVVTVGEGVVSAEGGLPVLPATQKFQWVQIAPNTAIPITKFSGEATGGILGLHGGLIYFSPALDAAVSGSVIQIDSVEVCSKAYDTYTFPSPPDPPAFFTYGGTAAPFGTLNSLNSVLWGAFPRLSEAQYNLGQLEEEPMPAAVDGPATATLTEPFDPAFVAYLNSPGWVLFDGVTPTTPPMFICANNLGPIPPGPTTVIVLQP